MRLVDELHVGCELGEGVLWHPGQQSIWWTDILGCRLYCYTPERNSLREFTPPERLSAFGFTSDPNRLIVSFASGIADYWPAQGRVGWLARPELGLPGQRFNDGRVDPAGRFWGGTMNEQQPQTPSSALYSYRDGCRTALTGLCISNGLCWSPDGRTAYHADSPTRRITAYDFSADGDLRNPRLFTQTPEGAYPDGACTDAAGNLWSAHWGAGQVVCYSPQGDRLQTLELPVSQPTCVAFGGPDYRDLYVTSAWEGMTEAQRGAEPRAGNLFVYRGLGQGRACDFYRPNLSP
jgi:sugar lactone lactonase YvrE